MARNRNDEDEPSLWSSPSFIGSTVVVGLLVVAGIVLSILNTAGHPSSDPPARKGSASASGATSSHTPGDPTDSNEDDQSSAPEPSVCGLPGLEVSGSLVQAPPATWSLVGTTAAPTVANVGPGKVDKDGYRSCYAHTVTGALLAAANFIAMGSKPTLQGRLNAEAVVPGPGRDALLKRTVAANPGEVRIQIAGFRVLSYTGDQAEIDLAARTSKGAEGAGVLYLQWSGGDWKLRVADDGSSLTRFAQLPDLTGYIPWSGA